MPPSFAYSRCELRWKLAAAAVAATALSGCQFLFPTPLDLEADTRPSGAAHALGDGFLPGEHLSTEITLDGVVAGVGELKVGARCTRPDGRLAVPVLTIGRSAGLVKMLSASTSEVFSLVDAETSLPIEGSWNLLIGEKRTIIEESYGESSFRFRQLREQPDKPRRTNFGESTVPIDGIPHDGHTSVGFLRHWHPEPGARGNIYAVYGRYIWRADLTFRGSEVVTTPLGEAPALRIDGVATKLLGKQLRPSSLTPRRPFSLWVSDDERHIPLRVLVETPLAKVSIDVVGYDVDGVIAKAAPAPCTDRVDEKVIAQGLAKKKKKEEDDDKSGAAAEPKDDAKAGSPAEDDDDKDEREDKENLEKLMKR